MYVFRYICGCVCVWNRHVRVSRSPTSFYVFPKSEMCNSNLALLIINAPCNTLQHTATHCQKQRIKQHKQRCATAILRCSSSLRTATYCNILQHTATYCNTLQHTATYCNILQHTATYCNILQQTATYCNALQHICTQTTQARDVSLHYTASHCSTSRLKRLKQPLYSHLTRLNSHLTRLNSHLTRLNSPAA